MDIKLLISCNTMNFYKLICKILGFFFIQPYIVCPAQWLFSHWLTIYANCRMKYIDSHCVWLLCLCTLWWCSNNESQPTKSLSVHSCSQTTYDCLLSPDDERPVFCHFFSTFAQGCHPFPVLVGNYRQVTLLPYLYCKGAFLHAAVHFWETF